jgi:MFS family permease
MVDNDLDGMTSLNQKFSSNKIMVVCILAFLADMVGGIMSPTKTLFALDIGASITFVGLMSAVESVVAITCAIPIGIISDRRGRKMPIVAGFILRLCSTAMYGFASNQYHLLASVVLHSLGVSTTFMSFRAYIADFTEPQSLGRAVALYSTAMGIGVTIGPLVGGLASGLWGYRQSYFIASILAFIGFLTASIGIRTSKLSSEITQTKVPEISRLFSILKQPSILWLSLMNIINFTIMMVIMTYFPVLGKDIGFTSEIIGFIFFVRGLATTVIRLPTGLATTKLREQILMISTLVFGVLGLIALPFANGYLIIVLLLISQGLSFGAYLTSSSTFLLHLTTSTDRGTTLGLTRIFTSMINIMISYLVGASAETLGIRTTFLNIGLILGVMLLVMIVLGYLKKIYNKIY